MMVVGLTGSIAVGKSEVARLIEEQGIPVFDADKVVHALYQTKAMVDEIGRLFPEAIANGEVNRARLGEHLRQHPQDFAALEALVHPKVRLAMQAFLARERRKGAALAIVDVPLLFETGADKLVDCVVLVTADPAIQRARAFERPGMTEAKLAAILARQLSQSAKVSRAGHVVENSGSREELGAKVGQLVYALKSKAGVQKT
jgi:dephospho-CoA kinase